MNDSEFVKDFKPFRGKYSKKFKVDSSEYLFPGNEYEWRIIHRYLKKSYIEKAITGSIIAGWFTNTLPNIIGIDIDDHEGQAWSGVKASPRLLSLLDQILKIFPEPSLLVQSPRGLHIYYVLNDRIPSITLEKLARNKLKGIECKIIPTPDLSLRIPEDSRILNPKTLLPAGNRSIGNKYHPAILFDDQYLPAIIRDTLQDRKTKLRSFQYTSKIQTVESLYKPITPGYSNEALNNLVPVYKGAGLSPEEAIYRFTLILQESPLYSGELCRPRRLEQRIRSYYRKDVRKFIPGPRTQQLNLLHKPLVDYLVSQSPFVNQRNKPVEKFLYELLNWCSWHDEIVKSHSWTTYSNYLFPYYRKNRKEGYYPLPQTKLKQWNKRYNEFMKWLQEIGFIVNAPYKYVPKQGICKYYKIREVGIHIKEQG